MKTGGAGALPAAAIGPMVEAAFAEAFEAHRQGRPDIAEALYRRILRHAPNHANTLNYLGVLTAQSGNLREGIRLLTQAVRQRGASFDAFANLGRALGQAGRPSDEARCYRHALALKPDSADLGANLADALQELGWAEDAVAVGRRTVRLDPGLARGFYTLASALRRQGRSSAAVCALKTALALNPAYARAWSSLGTVLLDQRRHRAAEACDRRALAVEPGSVRAHSNLLMGLNYRADLDGAALCAEHRRFDDAHMRRLIPATPSWRVRPDPGRRLRVGYLSADFREHSVAYFVGPLLAAHDRRAVETVCYADVAAPDEVTLRLRKRAEQWRDVAGLDDAQLAELVRNDRIDILVDLAGHTAGNRLAVFARRPAPVQVTWLGYPNTTGLTAMTARIADAATDPEGVAEAHAVEALCRLSPGFLCYEPPVAVPAVVPLPSAAGGPVTFGSFNTLAKLTAEGVALWARVLHAVPGSRLALKSGALGDDETAGLLAAEFAVHGVGRDRLDLLATIPDLGGHFAAYGRIDVALDPFPYNGTTTTCEALWMGVPVVSLLGDRHAGRVGASILGMAGLGELVARSPDEYVRIAAGLAADPARLAELRAGLRDRLSASPLCDAKRFAAQMEGAYRGLWRDWCATAPAAPARPGSGRAGR